jgi:hypothetical protein
MLTQKSLLNIIMAASLVGCFVLEHYGIVPVGTSTQVVLLEAGLAAGSGSLVPNAGQPVLSGGGSKLQTQIDELKARLESKPGTRG